MVGLARSWRHMDSTSSCTAPSSSPSTSRVIKRPTRTLVTPRNPRAGRDLSTVAPCGSRMPSLGVICTETLNTPPPFLVPSTTTFPQLQLHNPAENLCICIFHTAHIPAKAILVQPLAGLHIPQPACVRGYLIPQTDGPAASRPNSSLKSTSTRPRVEKKSRITVLTRRDISVASASSSPLISPSSSRWVLQSRGSLSSSFLK